MELYLENQGSNSSLIDLKKTYQERLDHIEKIKRASERVKIIERFETKEQGIFIYYEIDGMPCLKYGDGFTCDWDQWDHEKMEDYPNVRTPEEYP